MSRITDSIRMQMKAAWLLSERHGALKAETIMERTMVPNRRQIYAYQMVNNRLVCHPKNKKGFYAVV